MNFNRRRFAKSLAALFIKPNLLNADLISKPSSDQMSLARTIFVSFNGNGPGMHLVGRYGRGLRKKICGNESATDTEFFDRCYRFCMLEAEAMGYKPILRSETEARKLFDTHVAKSITRDPILEAEYREFEKPAAQEKPNKEGKKTLSEKRFSASLYELSNGKQGGFDRETQNWQARLHSDTAEFQGQSRG